MRLPAPAASGTAALSEAARGAGEATWAALTALEQLQVAIALEHARRPLSARLRETVETASQRVQTLGHAITALEAAVEEAGL